MSVMTDQPLRARARFVLGPDGSPLTVADLPPQNTKRWVIRRKAEVVLAVRGGLLTLDEACDRYSLTNEEFLAWPDLLVQLEALRDAVDAGDVPAIKAVLTTCVHGYVEAANSDLQALAL